jgi:hypothetical protein
LVILRMSLIKKATQGKVPVYFVLAHGKDYSPSSQTVTSVPKGKNLILPVDLGETLSYAGAEELAKRLGDRNNLNNLLLNLPSKFTLLKETEQFPDTVLSFYDEYFWTGIYELPRAVLKRGLRKEIHSAMNVNMATTPPRKRLSTFLNENPNEEAIFIVASCRGVKGVPSDEIYGTKTKVAKRTSEQKRKLVETKKDVMRTSKKRPTSKSAGKSMDKKRKVEPSKKRKRTPNESSRKKAKISTSSPIQAITQKINAMKI